MVDWDICWIGFGRLEYMVDYDLRLEYIEVDYYLVDWHIYRGWLWFGGLEYMEVDYDLVDCNIWRLIIIW